MSVLASAWAWEVKLPAPKKLILLCYADFANDAGQCWPSHSTVARKCGTGVKTVQRTLRELESAGLAVVDMSPGKTNRITLRIGAKLSTDPGHCDRGGGHSYDRGNPGHSDRGPAQTPVTVTGGVDTAMTGDPGHSCDHRSTNNHQDPDARARDDRTRDFSESPSRATSSIMHSESPLSGDALRDLRRGLEGATGHALDAIGDTLANSRVLWEADEAYAGRLLDAISRRLTAVGQQRTGA